MQWERDGAIIVRRQKEWHAGGGVERERVDEGQGRAGEERREREREG